MLDQTFESIQIFYSSIIWPFFGFRYIKLVQLNIKFKVRILGSFWYPKIIERLKDLPTIRSLSNGNTGFKGFPIALVIVDVTVY